MEPPETLAGLLRQYSPTGQEAQAANWLVTRMRSLGFEQASVDAAGNAVGLLGKGPRELVLLGHIDTVRGEIPVRLEEERLFGRGSVDAKGPLAAFVDGAAAAGSHSGWRLVVVGAVEEEGDSRGARFVADQYHPEFAIVGEPSGWDRVTLGYKGIARARITVRRETVHSASNVPSACEDAIALWVSLKSWAEKFNSGRLRAMDQVQVALRGVRSGEEDFEEWASLLVWARLPLHLSPQGWYDALANLAGSRQAEVTPEGLAVPAYRAGKDNRLVSQFLRSIRAAGGEPRFLLKSGTADLNLVAPAWGCPALAYGPGDSALDHTPGEHIMLNEYFRAVGVLTDVLCHLMEPASGPWSHPEPRNGAFPKGLLRVLFAATQDRTLFPNSPICLGESKRGGGRANRFSGWRWADLASLAGQQG
ncbi:MAG: [LysW]-lysine hydrolase [Anaerolineales bacterium]|jgi:LysW-gamma-L-lysine carboxypeptidase